jgi:glutathione peroxidase
MRLIYLLSSLLLMTQCATSQSKRTVYDFQVKTLEGKDVSLKDYRGKVLLIVNTASECGFTPQYRDLELLYREYKHQGFEVLAFPSNDFGGQEPLEGMEIDAFCSKNYETSFPIFDKVTVKGKQAHPLFEYLSNKSENGSVNIAPKWNFQKYLISKDGKVVDFYLPTTSPTASRLKKAIEKELKR